MCSSLRIASRLYSSMALEYFCRMPGVEWPITWAAERSDTPSYGWVVYLLSARLLATNSSRNEFLTAARRRGAPDLESAGWHAAGRIPAPPQAGARYTTAHRRLCSARRWLWIALPDQHRRRRRRARRHTLAARSTLDRAVCGAPHFGSQLWRTHTRARPYERDAPTAWSPSGPRGWTGSGSPSERRPAPSRRARRRSSSPCRESSGTARWLRRSREGHKESNRQPS